MTMFTEVEQEAVVLNAVWDMIDGMVNFANFCQLPVLENTNLLPVSDSHARLLNILLTDFLSTPNARSNEAMPFDLPRAPADRREVDRTYLFYLSRICENPRLGADASMMLRPIHSFADWLEVECLAPRTWLPSIGVELDFRVRRITLIKICGDVAKHNFSRLGARVRTIRTLMETNGHPISQDQAYAMIPDFYDKFHDDVFAYHLSTIAEFLNEIRYGIFTYLRPEFDRSFEWLDPAPMYRFNAPYDLSQPFAVAQHWDLMNRVRGRPWFPRFTVTPSLKNQF